MNLIKKLTRPPCELTQVKTCKHGCNDWTNTHPITGNYDMRGDDLNKLIKDKVVETWEIKGALFVRLTKRNKCLSSIAEDLQK